MKRILSLVLCLLIALPVFAGCKNDKTAASSSTDSQFETSENDTASDSSQEDESFSSTGGADSITGTNPDTPDTQQDPDPMPPEDANTSDPSHEDQNPASTSRDPITSQEPQPNHPSTSSGNEGTSHPSSDNQNPASTSGTGDSNIKTDPNPQDTQPNDPSAPSDGGESGTGQLQNNWNGNTVELLNDADFSDGFSTSALINTGGYDGKIQFFTTGVPQWNLTQWYSAVSIKDAVPVKIGNSVLYSNQYKTVSLSQNSDSSTTLTLVCDGRAEYGGEAPSSDFYGWVHLGTEQYIRESPMLADLSSLRLKMNTKMDYIVQTSNADKSKYVTQYNIFMIIKNTNEKSEDYNKYIWVQICLYDTRYDYPPEYCEVDVGVAESSGEFIYTMNSKNILKEPFANGNNVNIDYDLLPIFKKALNTVQSKGGMPNTKWEDMELLTFGFGYEAFRGEKYSVSTSGLSLKAVYKNNSVSPVLGTSYTNGFSNPSDWVRAYGDWKISNGTIRISESNLWTNRITLNRQFYMGDYDIEYEMSLDETDSGKDCWAGISIAKQYMQDDHGKSGIVIMTTPRGRGNIGNLINQKISGGEISAFALHKNIKYKVEVRSDTATLYANGIKVCSLTDEAIKEGGYISLISGMASVTYTNFKVTVK